MVVYFDNILYKNKNTFKKKLIVKTIMDLISNNNFQVPNKKYTINEVILCNILQRRYNIKWLQSCVLRFFITIKIHLISNLNDKKYRIL